MRKKILKLLFGLLGLLLSILLVAAGAFLIMNRTNGSIVSGGQTRHYLLYVPESYKPGTSVPLIISMHGLAEWPAHQMQASRWDELANQYGFLVVFPAGRVFPLRWSTQAQAGSEEESLQDLHFLSELIDHLAREYSIDPQRIYANGLSNGGGMSFMLACSLSDRIAAIGTVSGAYLLPWNDCRPERPVPLIAFHGTEDQIVPYAGGPSNSFDVVFPPVEEWMATLAERNGCTREFELPQQGEVSGVHYTDCEADADVVFYRVAGGGHSWPGGNPLPRWIVGHTTQDVDASQLMWDFFQEHRLDHHAP